MNHMETLKNIFASVFEVDVAVIGDDFTSDSTDKWDSVNQMTLVNEMENAFDIMIDIDDIYEMISFPAVVEILRKYEVEL